MVIWCTIPVLFHSTCILKYCSSWDPLPGSVLRRRKQFSSMDFRCDRTVISWKDDFLLLLEGDELHFPAQKTNYAEYILFDRDTSIVATADGCFEKRPNCGIENYMMTLRWSKFDFTHEIHVDIVLPS